MYFQRMKDVSRIACCFLFFSLPNMSASANELNMSQQKRASNELTWKGEIKEIVMVKLKKKDFVTLLIVTGGETKKVWLAPQSYLGNPFNIGEIVTIEGIEGPAKVHSEIVAFRVIKSDGTIISCRTANGGPLWPKHDLREKSLTS
jgi:hypothetical protein